MLSKRNHFFSNNTFKGIGLCGSYIPNRDSIHVGIFCDWDDVQQVFHYVSTNDIKVEDIVQPKFEHYYFHFMPFIHHDLIDSILALAELVSQNRINNLNLRIESILYSNSKFCVTTGNYLSSDDAENLINCAIFVIAIFKSYDIDLLDVENWPSVPENLRTSYLDDWLNHNGIPINDRDRYYKMNKEIRGKHVFMTPLATNLPSSHIELEELSSKFLVDFRNNIEVVIA